MLQHLQQINELASHVCGDLWTRQVASYPVHKEDHSFGRETGQLLVNVWQQGI